MYAEELEENGMLKLELELKSKHRRIIGSTTSTGMSVQMVILTPKKTKPSAVLAMPTAKSQTEESKERATTVADQ